MAKRLNIGLFIDELDNSFTSKACQGAELGAQAIDANLYIFPGKYLDSIEAVDERRQYEYQYNPVFQYADSKNLDLIFVMMGTIGCRTDFERQIEFLKNYQDVPVVTLFTKLAGYPSVTFNNKIGFKKEIMHLIEDHHVKKIGLVSGPMTNMDAVERFEVYRDSLQKAGIPYSEDLVVYGDFEQSSGSCVRELLERHSDLEAVVFANDMMAMGGYPVIKEMGLEIGRDILVVSFDNSSDAVTMIPPLTTVEANPIELSYRAILHTQDFMNDNGRYNLEVETHFVRRNSCGCDAFDYETMASWLEFNKMRDADSINVEAVHQYLFGSYYNVDELLQIKDDLAVFLKLAFEMIKYGDTAQYEQDLSSIFRRIIGQPLLHYTTTEKFFNMLTSLYHECSRLLELDDDRMRLTVLFARLYQSFAIRCSMLVQGQQDRMEEISQRINTMTGDMFIIESEDDISYELALAKLPGLGIRSVYLYTYQELIRHNRHDLWQMPKKLLLKALCRDGHAEALPVEKQLIRTDKLLHNEFIERQERVTMVISPLFSGEEQYGVLLSEISYDDFSVIVPVTYQLSAALKSLLLIEQQQQIQRKLEQSIEKFKESNDLLNEISRSDELTGLYNRRGFLEYAHAAITNKRNAGRRALVAYADMDNLKMINDHYGHDEGDFALREIASILRDTFRSTDIVARFGGDEFVAFAMVGVENYGNLMKRRLAEITIRHNEAVNKPYPIEMSTGICEFECGPEIDLYEILDVADERLYEEKDEKKRKRGSYR